jgi:hypothetical protein
VGSLLLTAVATAQPKTPALLPICGTGTQKNGQSWTWALARRLRCQGWQSKSRSNQWHVINKGTATIIKNSCVFQLWIGVIHFVVHSALGLNTREMEHKWTDVTSCDEIKSATSPGNRVVQYYSAKLVIGSKHRAIFHNRIYVSFVSCCCASHYR